MNNQKPEAASKDDGSNIDLHSVFFTIQGEGPFSGHRSVFIRLAGCNIQCPGCDTEYTQGRETFPARHVACTAWDEAKRNGAEHCLVVLTGGEPFRQKLGPLIHALIDRYYFTHVQIETNGIFEPDRATQDFIRQGHVSIVVSPKTHRINPRTAELAVAYKYVLDHNSIDPDDGLPIYALERPVPEHVARPPEGSKRPVYVNPYDAKDDVSNALNLTAAALSAKRHGYILGVQLHKLAGLE